MPCALWDSEDPLNATGAGQPARGGIALKVSSLSFGNLVHNLASMVLMNHTYVSLTELKFSSRVCGSLQQSSEISAK